MGSLQHSLLQLHSSESACYSLLSLDAFASELNMPPNICVISIFQQVSLEKCRYWAKNHWSTWELCSFVPPSGTLIQGFQPARIPLPREAREPKSASFSSMQTDVQGLLRKEEASFPPPTTTSERWFHINNAGLLKTLNCHLGGH